MNKIRKLTLICTGAILISIVGISGGSAARLESVNGGGSPADYPWFIQIAESVNGAEVGQYASLAIHPASNKPYISHYDATNKDLHLSYPVDTGGNCGTDNAWYCEVVDTAGDVGQHSSIDLYYNSSSNDRKTGIAYYDATNAALKVAIWSCPLIGSCGWSVSAIQNGIGGITSFGRYSSLKFDSSGAAHISYHFENSLGDEALMYASYVGSGGNCGVDSAAGKWDCEIVESGPNTGTHTSLYLTSSDAPYISFYDISPGEMRVCNRTGTSWACATIDNIGSGFSSIALDQSNRAHIAYYDGSSGMLKYAHYVGSGGNCGLNAYRCDNITAIGTGLSQVGLSLAMDTGDNPIIAYQDASDLLGFPTLDIARPISVYTGKVAGNCGPTVGIIPQWQCDTLDDATQGGGSGHLYEAEYVAAAVDITGLASVAYYEYDDYYGEGRLKFTYQQRIFEVFLPLVIR